MHTLTTISRAFLVFIGLLLIGGLTAGAAEESWTVAFLGDSLTAGYGLAPEQAYPALIGDMLREQGVAATIVNGGISGDTTSGGRRRVAWLLKRPADVLVIALGANDGLRGVPVEQIRENLGAIITTARKQQPELQIILAGMKLPPNFGADYTEAFHALFAELAEEHETLFIPFLLEGVGGIRKLNQSDGIHPTAKGQRVVADNVWAALATLLPEPEG